MRYIERSFITAITLVIALAASASAEIVRTQVRYSLPTNRTFAFDVDADGTADFTVTSKLLQAYCLSGDVFLWTVSVDSAAGGAVVGDSHQASGMMAAALLTGVR